LSRDALVDDHPIQGLAASTRPGGRGGSRTDDLGELLKDRSALGNRVPADYGAGWELVTLKRHGRIISERRERRTKLLELLRRQALRLDPHIDRKRFLRPRTQDPERQRLALGHQLAPSGLSALR
jgi:hypothetical protein